MGVSRSDFNKVVQRAKKLGQKRRSERKALIKKNKVVDVVQGRTMSKKKLKKEEQRKRLIKKETQRIEDAKKEQKQEQSNNAEDDME